jgi:hypothetical protein
MPLVLADRVRDTTTTTGTGTVTLSGTAPTGYQTFGTAVGNGNTTYYTISGGSQWEVGLGTYSSTGPTLTRDTVLSSSNGNALVNFSAGTKEVFVTYPAGKAVYEDGSDNVGIGTSAPSEKFQVNPVAAGGSTFYVSGYDTGSGGANTNAEAYLENYNNDGYAGAFAVKYARGTKASPTAVQSGDFLGALAFVGYDGTTNRTRVLIEGKVDGTVSAGNIPTAILFNNGSNTFPTEKMRITSAGNVGIGTTTPSAKFQVQPVAASGSSFLVDHYDTGSGGANVNVWVRTENYNNDGYGDGMYALYARGTAASPTAVQSGDDLGSLASAGYDGTDFRYRAAIRFSVDGAVSSNTVPTAMTFRTGTSSQIERMRITSAGDVGIGTSAPTNYADTTTLTINGSLYSEIDFTASGDNGGYIYAERSGTTGVLSVEAAGGTGYIRLSAANAERMRITSGGNVGIGTTTPDAAALLDVSSTTAGFLPPRMTGTQRDAISTPPNGLMIYNTTTDKLQVRAAGSWVDLH